MTKLRDLAGEVFEQRYDCDRFTATVLTNRFGFIIDQLVSRVLTTAFSRIIRTGSDFAVELLGPPELDYPMVAVSNIIPIFLGSLPDAVRISFEEYGADRLGPGDVLICNDYYRAGTHANDVAFMRPIFHDRKLIAVMTIRAHMMDMGGIAPGGFRLSKRTTYEDGLRLPPILLYRGGEIEKPVMKLIFANTRFGATIFPDIQSIKASLDLGEKLVLDSIARYGAPAFLGAIRYANDASAETMGDALEAIPDGTYSAVEPIDNDGLPDSPEYQVTLSIKKAGRRAEFDWSGSSRASRSSLNCAWPDVKTALAVALKSLIDPAGRLTSGALRDMDIVLPPDAIMNPSPPHACQFYPEVVTTLMLAVFRALNPVLGPRGFGGEACPTFDFSSGVHEDGTPWVGFSAGNGSSAWGASETGDGDALQSSLLNNTILAGVEEAERDGHYLALSAEPLIDSGGPGLHRGGSALVNDTFCFRTGLHSVVTLHAKEPPAGGGAHGGAPGLMGGAYFWQPKQTASDPGAAPPRRLRDRAYAQARVMVGMVDPETNQLASDGVYHPSGQELLVEKGSIVRIITNGAGGWGDPFARDPGRVLRDVRDEYVSIEGAARDYGVVIQGDPQRDPEGLTIDMAATETLRRSQVGTGRPPA